MVVEARVPSPGEVYRAIPGLQGVQEALCERSPEGPTAAPRPGEVEVKVTRAFVLPAGGPVEMEMVVHTPCNIVD